MILLWNSADKTVELSLIDGENQWNYEWLADRNLARDMLAFLRDRLAEHEANFGDISGIGVFRGPGSFTGQRIGMTVLNTIASDRQVPIVGATGDDWRTACEARLRRGENDKIVLPEYGRPARVTRPRK
jgi:tRNA threonylcarbamoyladenosine biosynthesis protein TsaB